MYSLMRTVSSKKNWPFLRFVNLNLAKRTIKITANGLCCPSSGTIVNVINPRLLMFAAMLR